MLTDLDDMITAWVRMAVGTTVMVLAWWFPGPIMALIGYAIWCELKDAFIERADPIYVIPPEKVTLH